MPFRAGRSRDLSTINVTSKSYSDVCAENGVEGWGEVAHLLSMRETVLSKTRAPAPCRDGASVVEIGGHLKTEEGRRKCYLEDLNWGSYRACQSDCGWAVQGYIPTLCQKSSRSYGARSVQEGDKCGKYAGQAKFPSHAESYALYGSGLSSEVHHFVKLSSINPILTITAIESAPIGGGV
ncbi:hypothetical protein BJV78DRAFT_1337687 [Lactifluus subvellereus]|nr:hypothetical protein BJV78DRAFT_1337687 [Lactifluus subvellereus]